MNRGPVEYGQDNIRNHDERDRPGSTRERDPMTRDLGQGHGEHHAPPSLARTVQFTSGDFLLTVNPVDGSEIEPCPPGERPEAPVRHPAADRAELARAARPPVPPGPAVPELPLLERQEEREALVGLLSRGRSVRLVGSAGSGRTALLDAVAADCADLAPDGVVRLSGYRRTTSELLNDLFAAVFRAPLHRPDRDELLRHVHDVGAVVVLDDLEFGGAALEELLAATPECAFLIATTPDVAAATLESHVEEVLLGGLGRGSSLELLERAVSRPLTDEEANWAGDLWFESEGLPLRFVQAGALLRQRDVLRADPGAFDEYGYFTEAPLDAPFDAADGHDVPLPTLAEGTAPVAPLAARLSESARATLRFALALGGEVPHQAHLPALVGDAHADAALGELVSCGLLSPSGTHYRLASEVAVQLENAGYGEEAADNALTAAQHYAWWAGHPSVTPERISAEADAVLAALAALVPGTEAGHPSAAVLLARTAAPAFAAGMQWGAWERALRTGAEASRIAGEVGEEAYFHHELGILALCGGQLDRARAELETSVGLRGALADRRGTVAARRALALVTDRSGTGPVGPPVVAAVPSGGGTFSRSPFDTPYNPFESDRPSAGEEMPAARYEESASPPAGVPAPTVLGELPGPEGPLVIGRSPSAAGGGAPSRHSMLSGARRNLVAAGAGALLAAVLGTVVTLGATGSPEGPADKVGPGQSANEDAGKGGIDADQADGSEGNGSSGGALDDRGPREPGVPAADSTSRGKDSSSPDPSRSGTDAKPGDGTSTPPPGSGKPTDPPTTPTGPPTKPTDPPTKPTDPPPTKPTDPPTSPDPDPTTPEPDPPTSPEEPPTSPDQPPSSPEQPPVTSDEPPSSPANTFSAPAPTASDAEGASSGTQPV